MIHREVLGAVLGKLLVLRALEMLEGGRGPLTTLKALPGGEFAITGISHSLTHQRAKGQSQCLAGLGTHRVSCSLLLLMRRPCLDPRAAHSLPSSRK